MINELLDKRSYMVSSKSFPTREPIKHLHNFKSFTNRKAQAWGFDLIVATGIFIFGIIVFFLYTINYPTGEQERLDDLAYEGNIIADSLLSVGYPTNWTSMTVSKIGLLTDRVIDQNKVEELYSLANANYQRTKSLFGVKYNYFINFSESIEISSNPIEGIGLIPQNHANNIKISRVSIYKNKPVTIEVQVWN